MPGGTTNPLPGTEKSARDQSAQLHLLVRLHQLLHDFSTLLQQEKITHWLDSHSLSSVVRRQSLLPTATTVVLGLDLTSKNRLLQNMRLLFRERGLALSTVFDTAYWELHFVEDSGKRNVPTLELRFYDFKKPRPCTSSATGSPVASLCASPERCTVPLSAICRRSVPWCSPRIGAEKNLARYNVGRHGVAVPGPARAEEYLAGCGTATPPQIFDGTATRPAELGAAGGGPGELGGLGSDVVVPSGPIEDLTQPGAKVFAKGAAAEIQKTAVQTAGKIRSGEMSRAEKIAFARGWARATRTQNEVWMTNLILAELSERPVELEDTSVQLTIREGLIVAGVVGVSVVALLSVVWVRVCLR